jgi:monofunctional biosynthetic peptidoglycan transglycosylase
MIIFVDKKNSTIMNIKKLMSKPWFKIRFWVLFFFVFTISGVVIYRIIPVPFTPLMFQRIGEQILDGKKVHLRHHWVPMDKISSNMVLAAISAEDNNFPNHFGIDFDAIEKAQKHNKKAKRLHGASTITQQTCKNVYLWLGRTYVRKGLELYYTVMVEVFWSKRRIMEVYLNSIEMGDGIFGVEAAARAYFKKPASQLTRGESALIVAAFPNPRKRNPSAPSGYLLKRQQAILMLMNNIEKVKL